MKTKYGVRVPQEKSQEKVKFDPAQLAKYTGNYAAFGEVMEVSLIGKQLKARSQGISFNLVPLSKTTFQPKHWLVDLGLAELLETTIDLRQKNIEFMLGYETEVLGRSSIQVEDGVLQMAGLVGPMLPISETEIIILSGPFAGETMAVEAGTGNIYHQSIGYQQR